MDRPTIHDPLNLIRVIPAKGSERWQDFSSIGVAPNRQVTARIPLLE
jgi:hypothetical protein